MPRISLKKRAAYDILDWLFFNQTWFLCLYEGNETLPEDHLRASEIIALVKIRQRVNEEVANTGATGIAAQALKHTVYCMLEAGCSDDLVQKSGDADRFGLADEQGLPTELAEAIDPTQAAILHKYDQNFFMGLITALGEMAHGVCIDTACAIVDRVVEEFSDAPTAVRYRLTERVFILEFMDAPVKFLSWMHRIGVIESNKFADTHDTRDINDDFKARVGLLCEFPLMRDFMAHMRTTKGNDPDYENGKSLQRLEELLKEALSRFQWKLTSQHT